MAKVVIIPSDALERLGSGKGDNNYLIKKLVRALDPTKKKTEETKKGEWKWDERLMLWICFVFAGPIVGMIGMNIMAHLWHDTVNTLQNVPH